MRTDDAYAARAHEYAELLGSIEAMAPQDRRRIESWADGVDGPILDLGCGPGHWTAHLASRGHEVRGIDPVAEFVEISRRAHPGTDFRVGSFEDLHQQHGTWGGVLAWYSLIHCPPGDVPGVLAVVRDALRPAGQILLGFFDGDRQGSFDHAVAPAQLWPAAEMARLVEEAGFTVLDVETRQDPGARPHAALTAHR
ncbi:class I SAM-dependent DNA methyltransferase [Brachybacterium alimentarium]|uniref:class I SAM-dependent DNA methyltransferase n=1 Tax=Brachybacterium alimentarium TaxID=47845 RepID=UPI003FD2C701